MQNAFLKLFVKIQALKDEMVKDESGQDLIEYALVVALVTLGATATMKTFATTIGTAFTSLGTKLTTYTS
jgi:pilus assembly protein Flp/PilA